MRKKTDSGSNLKYMAAFVFIFAAVGFAQMFQRLHEDLPHFTLGEMLLVSTVFGLGIGLGTALMVLAILLGFRKFVEAMKSLRR